MRAGTALGTAALGGGLIAITYGLARFVFGLVLPAIAGGVQRPQPSEPAPAKQTAA